MRRLRDLGPANLILIGVGSIVIIVVFLWTAGLIGAPSANPALTAIAQSPSPGAFTLLTTPTSTSTPLATWPVDVSSATPRPVPSVAVPALPAVTAPAGGQVYNLTPAEDAVGWVRAGDEAANHLGDYNVYAGVFEGQQHVGAIQFDLTELPPGVSISYADLVLVGLAGDWLAGEGTWRVQLLQPWMDDDWARKTFTDLVPAQVAAVDLTTELPSAELGAGRANVIPLDRRALDELEARTFSGKVSFRIQGPSSGADNLFAWDSGYGAGSQGWSPVLRVVAGRAPVVPPASPTRELVVVTSTPTPENVVTAAAQAATATAQAATTGIPGPVPPNWVTPIIVVPTATPANAATAQWHSAVGTAQASLYGTPTPLPPNVWTATPVSEEGYVVVTNTPTPRNWATAVAQAAEAATRRAVDGPPTPFPPWVVTATPRFVVVTSTPRPLNGATAAAISAQATIAALTTGTYTPVPRSWVTATPLPLLVPVERIPLTPTPTPTPAPRGIPAVLKNKIAFMSDRLGEPRLFVMDPDGSNVAWLTQSYPYDQALAREPLAPDGLRRVVVQADAQGEPQLVLYDPRYPTTSAITGRDGWAYDPAWSPAGDRIAYVSTEPGNDEIYTINVDGSDLRRLTSNTWEWDKHPSWSPDGRQIVFYSNRATGRRQIWIMSADGSGPRNLSNSPYNDWDPVWIK